MHINIMNLGFFEFTLEADVALKVEIDANIVRIAISVVDVGLGSLHRGSLWQGRFVDWKLREANI